MNKTYNNLPLRSGVGIVLLNKKNKIFVAKRIDNPKNYWQMPQGGIDGNEDYLSAALRELEEETSIKSVELLKEIDEFIAYELPKDLLGIIWKGKYRGQKQKWFVLKFEGNDDEINLGTDRPEFIDWKWVKPDNLPNIIVDFKKKLYEKLLLKIGPFIN